MVRDSSAFHPSEVRTSLTNETAHRLMNPASLTSVVPGLVDAEIEPMFRGNFCRVQTGHFGDENADLGLANFNANRLHAILSIMQGSVHFRNLIPILFQHSLPVKRRGGC